MRVLLTVAGTRGDVEPLFALARALVRAGHQAVVAGPPNFAQEAAALAVEYRVCGRDTKQMLNAHAEIGSNPVRLIRAARETSYADTLNHFDTLLPLAYDADIVVAAGLIFASASVAEIAAVPYRYLAYSPDALRSASHPPPLLEVRRLPKPINRWLWVGFGKLVNWLVARGLNERRRALGMEEVTSVLQHAMAPESSLLAADRELAVAPSDMRLAAPQLGSLRLDDTRPLPHEVERFLVSGAAPVYFGFGSMPDPKPQQTTREIVACANALGIRAVIARGWAELGTGAKLGPDVLVIGEVPHQRLFPRVAAVVHHGGAGTTTASMLAGVPQVVVPHVLDQFGWARRVHDLGLGPKALPRPKFNAARLTDRVGQALLVTSHAARARELAAALTSRDGLDAAVRALESAVGVPGTLPTSRRPSQPPAANQSTRPTPGLVTVP